MPRTGYWLHRVLFVALIGLILISFGSAAAQNPPQSQTFTGYLAIIHGDGPRDSNILPVLLIYLQDDRGQAIAQLNLDYHTAFTLRNQPVRVTGIVSGAAAAPQTVTASALPVLDVTAIAPAVTGGAAPNGALPAVSGSYPWVNVLCKFADRPSEPYTPAQYNVLFGASYPGINHFWQQMSFGAVNINGTTSTSVWVTLPQPRSYYVPPTGYANLDALFNHCTAAADALVNYTLYSGINLMFNDVLDCCAWGGSRYANLDGQFRKWSTTWLPPWAQEYDYITHEMGHGFGLPHSSGPQVNTPSGLDIYISQWDVMSRSGGTCAASDPNFGCIPPGTIGYHLDMSGWIPASRVVTIAPGSGGTFTLERLRQPVSSTNPLLIKIPMNGSSSRFYTVEARFTNSGYDQNIPASAVIIHDVLLGRGGWPGTNTGPSLVVVSDPYAGSAFTVVNGHWGRWIPGETYTDVANDIKISVIAQNASSFTVQVSNQLPSAPTLLAPISGTLTTSPPTFTWNAVRYAVSYDIQVDTTSDFSSGAVLSAQTTTTSYRPTGPLADARRYYWRARTRTNLGTVSDWSATASFQLDSAASAAPLRAHMTSAAPILTWSTVTWAAGYEIQVSRLTNFSVLDYTQTVGGSVRSQQTVPLQNGTYYWRVRALRLGSIPGPWSATDSFVINVPAP